MAPSLYEIENTSLPQDVDMSRVMDTLRALKLKKSFLIPAAECPRVGDDWSTRALGQRVHHAAGRLGIKVKIRKERNAPRPGLRIWRIA